MVYVTVVITTYWLVSITMVYLNKFLMTNNDVSIPAPLFVTWFQCFVTSVICYIAGYFGDRAQKQMLSSSSDVGGFYTKLASTDVDTSINGVVNGNGHSNGHGGAKSGVSNGSSSGIILSKPPSFISQFPKATFKPSIAIRIFPLSLVFVGMITFNNLCLTFVQVSFYNVARSLTIVFNIFLSWMILGIKSSGQTVSCLIIVIAGFYIGCQGELNYSSQGTYFGTISSLFVSLNSIYTKKVLALVDDNHWKLTFYNNVNACMILLPLVYHYEMKFILFEHPEQLSDRFFWTLMILAGCLGFMIGIVTVLQIKATSPLCHNFSGTGKALVQSLAAFYVWKNEPTKEGVMGIVIVLGGSLLYTYMKMKESSSTMHNMMKSTSDVESSLPSTKGNGER